MIGVFLLISATHSRADSSQFRSYRLTGIGTWSGTAAADALRKDNPNLRESLADELQMTFREIQKRRAPQLSTAEWVELFRVRGLEYAARCERQRDEAIAGMIATIDEFACATGPEPKWRCPCGEVLDNPGDPAVMAVHQPHYLSARKTAQSR
jgi:hypothetical protein